MNPPNNTVCAPVARQEVNRNQAIAQHCQGHFHYNPSSQICVGKVLRGLLHALQPKFGGYLQHFTAQDVAYFRDMPFSLSIPSHGVLVAHAGVVPERPLEEQLLSDMLNVRLAPVLLQPQLLAPAQ